MTEILECLDCRSEIVIEQPFEKLCNDDIVCGNCGCAMVLNYDESFDEEGEGGGWFYFDRK